MTNEENEILDEVLAENMAMIDEIVARQDKDTETKKTAVSGTEIVAAEDEVAAIVAISNRRKRKKKKIVAAKKVTPKAETDPKAEAPKVEAPKAETPEVESPKVVTANAEATEIVTAKAKTPDVAPHEVDIAIVDASEKAPANEAVAVVEPVVEVIVEPATEVSVKEVSVRSEPASSEASEPASEPTVIEADVCDKADAAVKKEAVAAKEVVVEKPAVEKLESTGNESETVVEQAAPTANGFCKMGLSEPVVDAVKSSGYSNPTPVQAEIIPHVLQGRDVLVQSQTGTGKTAAFALPILSNIETKPKKPQVLVLAPTRELAIQVARSFATYAANIRGFSVAAIYGGQSYEPQLKQLNRGVNVVVGTPGRVIDHIKRGTLDISEIKCLVLDEADEVLNMGFLEDVEFVLEKTPENRQVALFSATLPNPIRKIAERYLSDPARVTIKEKTMTADSIRQRAVYVSPRDKVSTLIRFLEVEDTDGVIVFTRTRESTTVVAEKLIRAGLCAVALNGDMPQATRERTIQRLKSGQLDILVATDVAARGLDVTRVSHVFNYDLPEGSESYVHRIGRTGRAGRSGDAIIFLTRGQKGKLRQIEKVTRKKIEIVQTPDANAVNEKRIRVFKETIKTTIETQDLSHFKKLIGEYVEESGQSVEVIAAALAKMSQPNKSFVEKDRPSRSNERSEGRGKRDNSGMKRYRISVGKRDGVRPGNIVGAITNEAGIDGDSIGAIKIFDSYSMIDLANLPAETIEQLQHTSVSGRELKLTLARREDSRSGGGNYGRSGNGNYGKRNGNKFGGKSGARGRIHSRNKSGGGGGKYKKSKA